MRWMIISFLSLIVVNAGAEDFDSYCKKSIKGSFTAKKKKSICWCVEDAGKALFTSEERTWFIQRAHFKNNGKRTNASALPVFGEETQKRLKSVEYTVFKNCSLNPQWKPNKDDLGVPDGTDEP
jgi:hypothetical protein